MKRRRRPACAWGAPSLVSQAEIPPTCRRRRGLRRELEAQPYQFERQKRLPGRLARPELDNAVFASILQPLAN